jgi:hypothetical protein
VGDVAFLRGLVVVGADLERGVGADLLGEGAQLDGLGGAVEPVPVMTFTLPAASW